MDDEADAALLRAELVATGVSLKADADEAVRSNGGRSEGERDAPRSGLAAPLLLAMLGVGGRGAERRAGERDGALAGPAASGGWGLAAAYGWTLVMLLWRACARLERRRSTGMRAGELARGGCRRRPSGGAKGVRGSGDGVGRCARGAGAG